MPIRVDLAEEPRLLFGRNRSCVDPKTGMLGYGPSGLDVEAGESRVIRAGAIGSHSAIAQLRSFLERLTYAIGVDGTARPEPWKVEFPGLGHAGPLGFHIELDPGAIEYVSPKEEQATLASEARRTRILGAVEMYAQKFDDFAATVHPPPDLVLLPLTNQLVARCKDPFQLGDRIVYERRTLEQRRRRVPIPVFDFHHVLKVLAFRHSIHCQLLLPPTMAFSERRQDPATIAWNFSAAAYYKGTGIPWKLADLDDRACLVGISFFQDSAEGGGSIRASMAHVYMRTGESQVIRSKPFRWEDETRDPRLSREQAREILTEVVGLFRRQREADPSRIVVHKTQPFEEEEIAGFDEAVKGVESVDYIHVQSRSGLRFYHKDTGYPPVRGTIITSDEPRASIVLYTTGFTPSLGTYPGATVPSPLLLNPARLDTNAAQVARDVLAMTKLDWNSTDFCTREPVTISVSRKVGEILAEMKARQVDPPPQSYSYYM